MGKANKANRLKQAQNLTTRYFFNRKTANINLQNSLLLSLLYL